MILITDLLRPIRRKELTYDVNHQSEGQNEKRVRLDSYSPQNWSASNDYIAVWLVSMIGTNNVSRAGKGFFNGGFTFVKYVATTFDGGI